MQIQYHLLLPTENLYLEVPVKILIVGYSNKSLDDESNFVVVLAEKFSGMER